MAKTKDQDEKRKKWREMKAKQREKTRSDQAKLDQVRSADRERKEKERKKRMEMIKENPELLEEKRRRKREYQRRFREKQQQNAPQVEKPNQRQLGAKKALQRHKAKHTKTKQRKEKKESEEKRKSEVLRVQNYRLRIKLKDPEENMEKQNVNTDSQAFPSRSTECRVMKRITSVMPRTPKKKARLVEKIIDSPQTKQILQQKGMIATDDLRQKAEIGENIIKSFQ